MAGAVVQVVAVFDALVPKDAMQQFGRVMEHQIVLIAHLDADLEAASANPVAMVCGHGDRIVGAEIVAVPLGHATGRARPELADVAVNELIALVGALVRPAEAAHGDVLRIECRVDRRLARGYCTPLGWPAKAKVQHTETAHAGADGHAHVRLAAAIEGGLTERHELVVEEGGPVLATVVVVHVGTVAS